jgi:inulin fructotransferase (DFA-I-forming)
MTPYDNGLHDQFGLLHINGNNNSVIANHISESIDSKFLKPPAVKPVIIRVVSGRGNYIANNHVVATTETSETNDAPNSACFSTQVGALLSTENLAPLDVIAVMIEEDAVQNVILDSGTDPQVSINRTANAFRATPSPER